MRKTTGISLILLIFLSLCLLTFSLLSLSGSLADAKLSQKAADRTTEYYAAVSKANEKLAELDAVLQLFFAENSYKEKLTAEDFVNLLLNADELAELSLHSDSAPAADPVSKPYTLAFDVAVNETQQLHVVLSFHAPDADFETCYDVVEWKIINTQKWNADQSQNLLRIPFAGK